MTPFIFLSACWILHILGVIGSVYCRCANMNGSAISRFNRDVKENDCWSARGRFLMTSTRSSTGRGNWDVWAITVKVAVLDQRKENLHKGIQKYISETDQLTNHWVSKGPKLSEYVKNMF